LQQLASLSSDLFGLLTGDKRTPIELLTFFKKHRPDLLDNINYDVYGASNANEYLNKLFDFQDHGCPYVALITDSVTFMTSGAVNWSMGFRGGPQKDKGSRDKDGHKLIPDFDEYKVETSLASQAMDITKTLPVFNIWTAHPLPKLDVKGSGNTMSISKSTTIVSYGQKVGAMIPGGFSEIYHFGRRIDYNTNPTTNRRIVMTDMIGDDFAKTSLNLPKEFDITDRLFAEVWKELVNRETIEKVVTNVGRTVAPATKEGTATGWVNPFSKA
jgi:hypothetical protein